MNFQKQKQTLTILVAIIISVLTISHYAEMPNYHFNQVVKIGKVAKASHNIKTYEVIQETIREVTAYNVGDISQCSGNPCISANGEDICLALELGYKRCAANFLPFGTMLHIENYGECLVVDRMNSRYTNRVDIAMSLDEKQRAINFGLQRLKVRILK